jgi:uncharacterized protein YecT (DUF1311 family)
MRILPTIVLAIAVVLPVGEGRTVPPAETQTGMNAEADHHLKAAEAEMNAVLNRLISKTEGKARAIAVLRKAQESWQGYRDAQLNAMWPSPEGNAYGTVYPMCIAVERTRLTESRIAELRLMLQPVQGDACGSQWPE